MSCSTFAIGRLSSVVNPAYGRFAPARKSRVFLTTITFKNCRNMCSHINVLPDTALVDEKVDIDITGLEPESLVTIRSKTTERKMTFESHAHYIANAKGAVNLAEQPSLGGNYTGVESMGLFWSMLQSPGQRKGLRFAKLNVDTPIVVDLSLHKGHLDTTALQDDIPLTSTKVHRWYKADNVERIPVRSGNVRGVVLKPKGSGKYPGVIDMFGSVGGLIEFRSALLASRGFAVLNLPYFGYEDLPESTWDIDFEYFEEAVDWFSQQSFVSPGGVGVMGVSLGGTLALLMATHCREKISAVVSISSPVTCLFAFSFRHHGEYMQPLGYDPSRIVEGEFGIISKGCPDDIRTAPENVRIQVEKARNLLFIVGEDDENFTSLLHAQEAIKRLDVNGHRNYELLSYPGAGHLIEPPYIPMCRASYHRVMGWLLDWGGNMADHAKAQEDAWPKVLRFFRKHVGQNSTNYNAPKSSL